MQTPEEYAKDLIERYGIRKAVTFAKRNANEALDRDSEDYFFDVLDEVLNLCPEEFHDSLMGCDTCGYGQ